MTATQDDDVAWIRRAWPGFASGRPVELRRLPGRSHRVYECVADGDTTLVVRLADPAKARFATEAALIARAADAGVPVPLVRHVGSTPVVDSGPVAVMVQERVPGRTLARYAAEADPQRAGAAVAGAGEWLAAIHRIPAEGFGNVDERLRGPADTLGAWFVDGLAPNLARAREIEPAVGPLLDRASDLLGEHRVLLDESGPGLLHGDYSPDNIVVDDAGRVAGVLDWEAAKSGPPELDIGWWDCFFDTPSTPVAPLLEGYGRRSELEPRRLRAMRGLTVLRILVGHFS